MQPASPADAPSERAQPFGEGVLPRLFVGTSHLGSVLPLLESGAHQRAFPYLDGLLELGCNAFDLAASYQLGGTERLLGAWMASRGHRDRLFLATKGGLPLPVVAPHRLTAKALTGDLHASLRRLRTDHVDLYLLHRDDPTTPLEPLLEVLTGFVRAGLIRAWGLSNWTVPRIQAMDALARASGVPSAAASSPHFSLAEWRSPPWTGTVSLAGDSQREAREHHRRTGLPVLAWSPLGQGYFAGAGHATYQTAANAGRRQRAQELAQRRGIAPVQLVLAYLLNQPFPVYPIVATSDAEQMRTNLEAAKVVLTEGELRWLEDGGGPPP